MSPLAISVQGPWKPSFEPESSKATGSRSAASLAVVKVSPGHDRRTGQDLHLEPDRVGLAVEVQELRAALVIDHQPRRLRRRPVPVVGNAEDVVARHGDIRALDEDDRPNHTDTAERDGAAAARHRAKQIAGAQVQLGDILQIHADEGGQRDLPGPRLGNLAWRQDRRS